MLIIKSRKLNLVRVLYVLLVGTLVVLSGYLYACSELYKDNAQHYRLLWEESNQELGEVLKLLQESKNFTEVTDDIVILFPLINLD
jgi:hypothetical protein